MVLQNIKAFPLVSVWLIAVFLYSGIVVNALEITLFIIVWPFSKRIFRILLSKVLYLTFCVIPGVASWWANVEIHCYGDTEHYKPMGKEHAILLGNHRGDVDWLVGWRIADDKSMLAGCKCFVKDITKFIPTIGWSWWFAEYAFLKRNWDADKKGITAVLEALRDYPVPFWIGIYPEGTRQTPEKLKASQEYALSKGIEPLKHHLLPRPKGFVTTVNALKGVVPAVYVFTTMLENEESANFTSLLKGKPLTAHVHFRRFSLDEVPTGSYEETANWCKERFREMDDLLEYYFNSNKTFPGKSHLLPRRFLTLFVNAFWLVTATIPLWYGICYLAGTGSWTLFAVAISLLIVGFFLWKKIMNLVDTKQGSSYGLSSSPAHKPSQGTKKED